MKWFGKAYGAPYEQDAAHVEAPQGAACGWCGEAIAADDDGIIACDIHGGDWPLHYECQVRSIVGGVNHQRGLCHCFGGDLPNDPEDMTLREAARAAVLLFQSGITKH